MSYCTQADLENEFGERELILLTDRSGVGVIDSTVLAGAITRAGQTIERYLGASVPLAEGSVADLACDIARYHLYKDNAPETVRNRYKDAIGQLQALQANALKLAESDASGSPPSGVDYEAPDSVFTPEAMEGY